MEWPEQKAASGTLSRFSDLPLRCLDADQLAERGFEHPTAMQRAALPLLLEGRPVLIVAPSGSGRTALAGILAAERVDRSQKGLRALVLVPGADAPTAVAGDMAAVAGWPEAAVLAVQSGLRSDRVGGAIRKGAVLAVGTPSRVLDLVERQALALDSLALVVILEADLILDLGGKDALEKLAAGIPEGAQSLIFAGYRSAGIDDVAAAYRIGAADVLLFPGMAGWMDLGGHVLEVAEDEKVDVLRALCSEAAGEGKSLTVLARSAVWRERVEQALAGQDAPGCSVQEETAWSAGAAGNAGAAGGAGSAGGEAGALVSYHLPLDPGAWSNGKAGVLAVLVTPAEYWDLIRSAPPAGAPAAAEEMLAEAPAEVAESAVPAASETVPLAEEPAAETAPAAEAPETPEEPEAPEAPETSETAEASDITEAAEGAVTEEAEAPGEAEQAEPKKSRKRREPGPRQDGLTEAERVARRHIKRDAARKIERIDPEEAAKEAERLVRESVYDAVCEQAYAEQQPAEAPEAGGVDEQREEAARRRRLEVAARLDEARRQLALSGLREQAPPEAVPAEVPAVLESEPLTPAERRLIAFAQRTLEAVVQWLRAEGPAPAVHRALAERLLEDADAPVLTSLLLQRLFPLAATPGEETGEAGDTVRLFISLGRQAGVNQSQLVRLVEQMAGVGPSDIGRADILARYSFLEVKAESAEQIMREMNGKRYRGREIVVDRAKPPKNT